MKNVIKKILIFTLALSLVGCSSNTPRENKVVGATVGAAAGAGLSAGSGPSSGPITLVGIGAILGAIIGFSYEKPMENSDIEKSYKAIAAGKTTTWQNPNSKITYTIIPAPGCVNIEGNSDCKRFTAIQTTLEGKSQKIFRTACKGKRGAWHLEHEEKKSAFQSV